jgi:hypothetical protein
LNTSGRVKFGWGAAVSTPFRCAFAPSILILTSVLLESGLTAAVAEPKRPPFGEDCERIDYSTYVSGIPNPPGAKSQFFATITHDPAKPGVDYYWKCREPKWVGPGPEEVGAYSYAQAYQYYQSYYSGYNVNLALALITGRGGYNEFLNGTNIRTSTATSASIDPFGGLQMNFLFPITALPGGNLLVAGPYGAGFFGNQVTTVGFAGGSSISTTTNAIIAGGGEFGVVLPNGAMVYTLLAVPELLRPIRPDSRRARRHRRRLHRESRSAWERSFRSGEFAVCRSTCNG